MTEPNPLARRGAGARRALSATVAALALSACGFPTEVPQVDQRWIVPPIVTTMSVGNLLPAGVRVVLPDSNRFAIDVAPVSVTRPLSADCAACASANGTTVAKPAFTATVSASSALPADIAAATLAAGSVSVVVQNGYNFDPLRPSASARGYVVTTITHGGVLLARDSVDGATTALPPGGSLVRAIALPAATVTSSAPLTFTVVVNSPAGDPVAMNASRSITVTATPTGIQAGSASLNVVNRQVSAVGSFNLADIDAAISEKITGGAVLFDIENPFSVSGTVTVTFTPLGDTPVTRTLALAPGVTHPSITLSGEELRRLVGHSASVSYSGSVSGTSGPVAVSPKQAVIVRSRLDLTLHTGG